MANGTIAFDTLTTSDQVNTSIEKSIDTSYLFNSIPKMWVHAHEHESQDSFNIASSTDVGTGDFTFTATNLLVDRNACAFGSNQTSRNRRGHYINPLTNGFNVQPTNSSSSQADDDTSTALIGDLA
tara:strand:+ start:721 stop:1098 length:378 start_codon:yes stop_codon:yes gene_type:complete